MCVCVFLFLQIRVESGKRHWVPLMSVSNILANHSNSEPMREREANPSLGLQFHMPPQVGWQCSVAG